MSSAYPDYPDEQQPGSRRVTETAVTEFCCRNETILL